LYRETDPSRESKSNRFTSDGYYRTGDLGWFDKDGFLFLTGRKSSLIKTSTGRRIAVEQIEYQYSQSPYLDQVIVVGDGREYLTGLISVDHHRIRKWLSKTCGEEDFSDEHLSRLPEVRELIEAELNRYGMELASHEQIARFAILPEPLSVLRGELTPTLKIRRQQITSHYGELIEDLYKDNAVISGPPAAQSAKRTTFG
jgi:long-chain acyl-CoA synthetase